MQNKEIINKIANENNIEFMKRFNLYISFVWYLYFYVKCESDKYNMLLYGYLPKRNAIAASDDVFYLIDYIDKNNGELPERLQGIFNEWLLTKM